MFSFANLLCLLSVLCRIVQCATFPFLGSIYPPPSKLSTHPRLLTKLSELTDTLNSVLSSGKTPFSSFAPNETTISITLSTAGTETANEGDKSAFFLDFHFAALSLNQSGSKNSSCAATSVSRNSIYRIGSISKLFTVYSLLVNTGFDIWNNPVTDDIPELAAFSKDLNHQDPLKFVQWESVTVGALASQLSGIGRDYNHADFASQDIPPSLFGLPELPSSAVPTCGGNESQPSCSRAEFFRGFTKRHPVFLANKTPAYSNAAFRILAYVLEKIRRQSYNDIVTEAVLAPLDLNNTFFTVSGNDLCGVIPDGDSGYFLDLGDDIPTAGIYSSSQDLASFGRAILASRQLAPAITNRWLKPATHTSSPWLSVGAPWEIYRAMVDGATIDLYTKSGSVGLYNSLLVLVPDYAVVLTLMTAGPDNGAIQGVPDMILKAVLPVLNDIAKAEECRALCGTYQEAGANSTMVIGGDRGPGLTISSWTSNGVDVLAAAGEYAAATGSGTLAGIRLYSTGLSSSTARPKNTSVAAFRIVFETETVAANQSTMIFNPAYGTWAAVDDLSYGGIAIDDFNFILDNDGIACAVKPRALRATYFRRSGR